MNMMETVLDVPTQEVIIDGVEGVVLSAAISD
jgi:hypothetical protein